MAEQSGVLMIMPALWWSTLVLVLVAIGLYWRLVSQLNVNAPGVLHAIDPRGFRALHAGSQLRFAVWLARGGFRDLDDRGLRRTGAALRGVLTIALALPAAAGLVLALTNVARDLLGSGF